MRLTNSSRLAALAAALLITSALFLLIPGAPATETASAQSAATEYRAASVTLDLNDADSQTLYEHDAGTQFVPTRLVIRRASGAIAAEGATTTILFDSTGDIIASASVPASALDEPAVVYVHNYAGRSGFIRLGETIRGRPNVAHGDPCVVTVDVYGVNL